MAFDSPPLPVSFAIRLSAPAGVASPPRALKPEALREIWNGLGLESRQVTMHARVVDALGAVKPEGRVLIAGSLYLTGEALALMENKAAAFERSAQ